MSSSELTSELNHLSCSNDDPNSETLHEMFDRCLKLYQLIEESTLDSNSDQYQNSLCKSIELLENCTKIVNELGLFSTNESIEEVSTADVRYFILPALLGSLSMKLQPKDRSNRLEKVQIAELYFKDFLKRCKNYDVLGAKNVTIEESASSSEKHASQNIVVLQKDRENKIQRYKNLKVLQEREQELKNTLTKSSDDDVLREYYLVMLEKWILTTVEELENIKRENEILVFMKKREEQNEAIVEKPTVQKSKPLAPMIITRNEVQKRVFGAGYPSLPVLSIEDFYQQRFDKIVKEHQQSLQMTTLTSGNIEDFEKKNDEIELEEKLERDDPIALRNARGFDDWKDENPRGSGNRKNKG